MSDCRCQPRRDISDENWHQELGCWCEPRSETVDYTPWDRIDPDLIADYVAAVRALKLAGAADSSLAEVLERTLDDLEPIE